ncbi:MAG: restriction endonuclease subunit S [Acidobacteriota bacterium]
MSRKINSELKTLNSEPPSGWRWMKLGEVCKINPSRPRSFYRSPNAPTSFVPMVAVDEKTGTISKPEIVPYSKVAKGYTYFEENDVLFAKITPRMQNGKHVIARNLIDGIGFGTTEFHVLRPNEEVLPEWVHFYIRQPSFLQEATGYFTGAVGQQRVPEEFLANYIIPLPTKEEQEHIAAKIQELMHEVEHARTACEKQLEAAKALPAAYLREVFESEEAKKWERKRLGEVLSANPQYGLTATAVDIVKDYIYLRITDITEEGKIKGQDLKYIESDKKTFEKYKVSAGDILIARSGSVGRVYLVKESDLPRPAVFASYLIRFRLKPDYVLPEYFFYFALSEQYKSFISEQIKTVAQPNINAKQYQILEIPLPPIETQQRIAIDLKEKLAQVEKLQSAISNQKSALDALPQAILRKAFRGEL